MHLYEATINLHAKNSNQVIKSELTAAEIMLLQDIHGNTKDAGGHPPVINIKFIGDVQRTDAEERMRLIGDGDISVVSPYKVAQFRKVFPTDYVPLPQALPGFETAAAAAMPATPAPQPVDDFTE